MTTFIFEQLYQTHVSQNDAFPLATSSQLLSLPEGFEKWFTQETPEKETNTVYQFNQHLELCYIANC